MEIYYKNRLVLIDDCDIAFYKSKHWFFNGGYLATQFIDKNGNKKIIKYHRLILNPKENELCDHINRNKLDNRRCNLRICTKSQNSFNRLESSLNKSGQKGVHFNTRLQKWIARITENNNRHYLGLFEKKEDAILAYKKAEIIYHGDFRPIS